MKLQDECIDLAPQAHGHMCAGGMTSLRMAICGMKLLGMEDPGGRDLKRLITFTEIDRCATDAIPSVTGCLGNRGLRFRDFGKVAAAFCDLKADRALPLASPETSKRRARELYPEIADKNQQRLRAYHELTDEELFSAQWVRVRLGPDEFAGCNGDRRGCDECGQGFNLKLEVIGTGRVLCKACAGERHYTRL